MTDAVIVSTARTPLAKSWKGAFNMTHGATLGGHAIEHAVKRAGIDPAEVEDVLMGCANPEGATGWNIARQAALRAGMPDSVAGATVNRFCSSGLQSVAMAAHQIINEGAEVAIGGGVESITMSPRDSQPLQRNRLRRRAGSIPPTILTVDPRLHHAEYNHSA